MAAVLEAASSGPKRPRVPPSGIRISDTNQAALRTGTEELNLKIQALRATKFKEPIQGKWTVQQLLPDVEIFHKAVIGRLTMMKFTEDPR